MREHWAEFGIEHGNPMSNRRFWVNAPVISDILAYGGIGALACQSWWSAQGHELGAGMDVSLPVICRTASMTVREVFLRGRECHNAINRYADDVYRVSFAACPRASYDEYDSLRPHLRAAIDIAVREKCNPLRHCDPIALG